MARTLFLAGLSLTLAVVGCGGSDGSHHIDDADVTDAADVVFVPDVPHADVDVPDVADAEVDSETAVACESAGALGCACTSGAECNSNVCIEGAAGNICTRTCIADCPDGYDCLATAIGGGDPISICVPRHTRLCRPCDDSADCRNPLDASPAVCVPDSDPSVGSFCATSCAQLPCPSGYDCQDVPVGEGSARLCMKHEGECECRPAWAALALSTSCENTGDGASCAGARTCTSDGLSACSAKTPATETCNGIDDDCNGQTDDIAPTPCTLESESGSCPGTNVCNAAGEMVCSGAGPRPEICNGVDDDCDGQTDESWTNCLPSGCHESQGVYVESGDPSCVSGQCAYANPRACGLYACAGGGDAGDVCATSCSDDTTCVASAHCDGATHTCVPDLPDGGSCTDATECATGHCQNGFCCAGGDCCHQPHDCPDSYRVVPHCDNTAQCQGTRHDAACVDAVCSTSEPIADDSGCDSEQVALDCTPNAPRYCNGQPTQTAPSCATTCTLDAQCASGFHCDGTCVADQDNGGTCDEDSDCVSDHCTNGFCCTSGTCCALAANCPASFRDPASCMDAFTCQGERIDATCLANTCDSTSVSDDSGCDVNVQANGCGPFAAVYCSGGAVQTPPQCAFSCSADSECDAGFHCDVICVPNLPDGNFCDEDSDCTSAHCMNGLCCGSGDCCNLASDCPAAYTSASVCDNPASCQGTRDGPLCGNHICQKVSGVGDDSACTNTIVANTCGPYPSVRCVGGANQQAPQCATSCTGNAECDADFFCINSTCQPKRDPGSACTDSAQCTTGHCQNGFCCGSGDCCASKNDCSPAVYGTPPVCLDGPSCQGQRKEPSCGATFQCALGANVADDSGCAGFEADTCGYFDSVFCSAAQNQPVPTCPSTCTSDNQCDNGAHCEGGQCVPDQGVGGLCEVSNQCGNGLACVDQRCCESSCTGVCRRCDAADAPGVCSLPAAGLDPDNECGAVSCTGYYWGFTGQSCFGRQNITADVAACDSDGTCQTASDICPSAAKGSSTLTCNATCQVPAVGSCSGTTPGACTNITGGTQTCGVGECANTVDKCSNGAPATCTPKQPSVEICDGKDNDCDGLTDAADPDMQLVPCDNQLGVCNGSVRPASLCVAGAWQPCTNAIYLAHSAQYQAGSETTCDGGAGVDNDCDGAADDDFTYVSPAGTSVRGAGKPCGVGACSGGTTKCGVNNTLVCSSDGFITAEVCDGVDNDCDAKTDSLDPSLVLIACQNQTGVCNGSTRPASLCAAGAWQLCQAAQYSAASPSYESDETRCDGLDNDCNTLIDDGLSPPLNSMQLGVCAGSRQVCAGTSGFVDSYTSVPNYNANESLPDGNYRDENCDGVDGNVNLAWFVSPTGSGTSCTRAAPCLLSTALGATARNHIYLRTGTYPAPGGTTYNITRVVKMLGGYGNDTSWTRANRSTNPTTITGGQWSGEAITVRIASVGTASDPVVLGDLVMNGGAPSGAGKSSYVIWAKSARLTVERSTISAANGAAGSTGGAGSNAASLSPPGQAGAGTPASESLADCDPSTHNPGGAGKSNSCSDGGFSSGGGGGAGGARDTSCGCAFGVCACAGSGCNATAGSSGSSGSTSGGTTSGGGGGGGSGVDICGPAGNGGGGSSSNGGGGGGATNAFGSLSADLFVGAIGNSCSLGFHGGAGGGGGGSGGCDIGEDSDGAGGGGGGGGGCRARAAGSGGSGGGGSFGIFALDTFTTVVDSTFSRGVGGNGGPGGSGGRGQPGGAGGAGGAADGDSKKGGDGGSGGEGGHSGAGGGGAGGPSYGIFWYRSSSGAGGLTQSGNNFGTTGSGGSGGAGGSGWISATNGSAGTTGNAGATCERSGNGCL